MNDSNLSVPSYAFIAMKTLEVPKQTKPLSPIKKKPTELKIDTMVQTKENIMLNRNPERKNEVYPDK